MNSISETSGKRFSLSLKDALFIGFCSVFAVMMRVVMRLKLHINGHSMLPTIFFLMLARGSVQYPFAATFAGFLAGSAAIFLGFAKSGPFILVKYLAAGLAIDLLALPGPRVFRSFIFGPLVGAAAGGTKFFTEYGTNFLIGMDPVVNLQRSLIEAGGAVFFGALAGLAVPVVIRRLKAYGVI
ncbi:MAG: hypothetical protein R2940_00860 [Syntrophotaleaceae bacterium]